MLKVLSQATTFLFQEIPQKTLRSHEGEVDGTVRKLLGST